MSERRPARKSQGVKLSVNVGGSIMGRSAQGQPRAPQGVQESGGLLSFLRRWSRAAFIVLGCLLFLASYFLSEEEAPVIRRRRDPMFEDGAPHATVGELAEETLDEAAASAGLRWALSVKNTPEIVRLYIAAGADIEERDENGLTPLMCAQIEEMPLLQPMSGDVTELTRILVEAGANVRARSEPCRGVYSSRHGGLRDYPDMTVLMWAAEYGRTGAVRILLDSGAGAEEQNSEGETAGDIAARNGDRRMSDILFFQNDDMRIALAYLAALCLRLFPFVICLLWLWLRLWRRPVHWTALIPALATVVFLLSGGGVLNAISVMKENALLLGLNAAALWQWFRVSDRDANALPSLKRRLFLLVIATWTLLSIFWIVSPFAARTTAPVKLLWLALIWGAAANRILSEKNWGAKAKCAA